MDRLEIAKRLRALVVEARDSRLDPHIVLDEFLHQASTGMVVIEGYAYAIEKLEAELVALRKVRENRAALKAFEKGETSGSA